MRFVGRFGTIAALSAIVLLLGAGGLVYRAHRDAGFALSQHDAVSAAVQLIQMGGPGMCTLAGEPDGVRGRQMPEGDAERLLSPAGAPVSRPDRKAWVIVVHGDGLMPATGAQSPQAVDRIAVLLNDETGTSLFLRCLHAGQTDATDALPPLPLPVGTPYNLRQLPSLRRLPYATRSPPAPTVRPGQFSGQTPAP